MMMGTGDVHQQLFGCSAGDGLIISSNCPVECNGRHTTGKSEHGNKAQQ